jgi:hypothetical protein
MRRRIKIRRHDSKISSPVIILGHFLADVLFTFLGGFPIRTSLNLLAASLFFAAGFLHELAGGLAALGERSNAAELLLELRPLLYRGLSALSPVGLLTAMSSPPARVPGR